MKKYLVVYVVCFSSNCFSQSAILKQPKVIEQCQTKIEAAAENIEIKRLKEQYYSTHKSAFENRAATHVLLGWPMRVSSDYDFQYNYFNLQKYVDQLVSLNHNIQDYNCSGRIYNGHRGIDASYFPFWPRMKDNNDVMAVAAAAGIILPGRADIFFDRNCNPQAGSNNVTILHDDGSTANYRHLKKHTVTLKEDNKRAEQAESFRFVGSSGRSTNPHLHFEVHNANDEFVEPFFNFNQPTCNFLSSETRWQNQCA